MRKIDIAHRMHQEAGIPEEQAAMLVDWVLDLIKSTLQKGEPVAIAKFGVFMVRSKAARPGRNPYTGAALMISSRRVVVFRASDQLKAEVSAVEAERKESKLARVSSSDVSMKSNDRV